MPGEDSELDNIRDVVFGVFFSICGVFHFLAIWGGITL